MPHRWGFRAAEYVPIKVRRRRAPYGGTWNSASYSDTYLLLQSCNYVHLNHMDESGGWHEEPSPGFSPQSHLMRRFSNLMFVFSKNQKTRHCPGSKGDSTLMSLFSLALNKYIFTMASRALMVDDPPSYFGICGCVVPMPWEEPSQPTRRPRVHRYLNRLFTRHKCSLV